MNQIDDRQMGRTSNLLHHTPRPLLIGLLLFCLMVSAAGLYVTLVVMHNGRWFPLGRLLFFGGFAWLSVALLHATLTQRHDDPDKH